MSEDYMTSKLKDADIVIFGGIGDLAIRKIFPALYYRLQAGQINTNSKVIVISRGEKSQSKFKTLLKEKLTLSIEDQDTKTFSNLLKICTYPFHHQTNQGFLCNS